jgi:hypothetical protein
LETGFTGIAAKSSLAYLQSLNFNRFSYIHCKYKAKMPLVGAAFLSIIRQ